MNLTGRPILSKPQRKPSKAAGLAYMRRVKQLPCVICNAPPPSALDPTGHCALPRAIA